MFSVPATEAQDDDLLTKAIFVKFSSVVRHILNSFIF